MKKADIAAALDVSTAQAKKWLHRLVELEQGVIEKQKKPAGYVVKQRQLFEYADRKSGPADTQE